MIKLRIICSDGLTHNIKLVNADTGEAIDDVYAITWKAGCDDDGIAETTVVFAGLPLEVMGVCNSPHEEGAWLYVSCIVCNRTVPAVVLAGDARYLHACPKRVMPRKLKSRRFGLINILRGMLALAG